MRRCSIAAARVLDAKRLGKQRVEAIQVLRALTGARIRLAPSPCRRDVGGIRGGAGALRARHLRGVVPTGQADTCATTCHDLTRTTGIGTPRTQAELAAAGELPPWLGDDAFHRSHQSALVRKDPQHYRKFFADVPDDLEYVWPGSDRPRRVAI